MALIGLLLALALLGLAFVAAAAFLVALPLGLFVVGAELLAAAYMIRYLEVRR